MKSQSYLIKGVQIVNEGKIFTSDLLIESGRIAKISSSISPKGNEIIIDGQDKYLLPGCIDDQVHFREPGLTHKGEIYTEAKAAVAGGVTSFMEMPNTQPIASTLALLEDKYERASQVSLANYSFFMGTTNSNADEALQINPKNVCGIKIFMGSSTGDMLVENPETLDKLFAQSPTLIAIHSENDNIVKRNLEILKTELGEGITADAHPYIRSVEACVSCTEKAIALAKKWGTRLHILHISTADEIRFFDNSIPLKDKKITSEACVHHLWFDSSDYKRLGNQIKCNPAIKEAKHKEAIFQAILDDIIDVIATDHAPHTLEEKLLPYLNAPSGLPLVQHSLNIMLEFYKKGKISLEKIVEKMAHNPAILFQIKERGYIKEGFMADLVLVNLNDVTEVQRSNLQYKCKWSPLEGTKFHSCITQTFVSGHLAYNNGTFDETKKGERLLFDR